MSGPTLREPHESGDWDALRYDRVSNPQVAWGRRVIVRLAPQPGERILDLGCGTGRLTAEIGPLVPGGVVVGLDPSARMLRVASQAARASMAGERTAPIRLVRGDGVALPFRPSFDALYSAATLHWIADHTRVFRSAFAVLRPGGRLVAQCGGGRNLERLYTRAARLMGVAPYTRYFRGWLDPWHFALPDETRRTLETAGFIHINVWLEASPVPFEDAEAYAEFIRCVCVRHHLERLPPSLHGGFVSELTAAAGSDAPPFTLDYWRLNIDARRPPA
jgi:trans-aconitate 2-methyltransferase